MVVNIFHLIKVLSHLLPPVQSHLGHDSICNFEMTSAGQRVGSCCLHMHFIIPCFVSFYVVEKKKRNFICRTCMVKGRKDKNICQTKKKKSEIVPILLKK